MTEATKKAIRFWEAQDKAEQEGKSLGREYIGIEINAEYDPLIRKRLDT